MNLAQNLTSAAAEHPDRPALKLDDAELTYAQLEEGSARVAGLLRGRRVQRGDRVGIMLPNVPYFAVCYYGVLRAGAVVVPMNVLLKAREVAFYLGDSEAKLCFAWHEFADEAEKGADEAGAELIVVKPGEFEALLAEAEPEREIADTADDDTAVILYTSGTTGTPKGAELMHSNLRHNADVAVELFGLEADSVVLGALPLFHSFGQTCGMNAAIRAGACLTLIPRFDPARVLDTIARDRVTVFEGVPTMYGALLAQSERRGFDTSSLRVCVSGGAALPVEVLHGFEAAFGCQVLEGYGLSETSPIACFNHPDRPRKPGSIGTPVRGVEMKLLADGEIAIRGHNVMKGYWRRPEATAEAMRDGWLLTGDIGRIDEDGYFAIVDRKKELIIRGGYNVYPREVEEVLYAHPAVREAAVVGVPHAGLGEEVGAAVALKDDAVTTADELREYVKERVAAYKYPRHVWLVHELPKGPTGKILKRAVAAPLEIQV
jgi:long-chain acyl-CoA synthetase